MTTQSIPPQGATHRNVLGNGWAKFIGGKQYSWTEIAGWVDVSVAGGFKLEFMQAMVRIPDALRFDESKNVAQSDAKPAAWIKPDVLATLRGDECCYAFGEQSPKDNLVPLFTRSDAGEVDRLNKVVEHLKREAKNDAIAYKAAIERQDEIRAERDQLKSEVEALRNDAFFHRHTQRQAELYQNVQMAAGSLPDGWQVVIEIERDAGTVSLLDADGEAVDEEFCDSGDLADQVAEALKYAVSKEGEQ